MDLPNGQRLGKCQGGRNIHLGGCFFETPKDDDGCVKEETTLIHGVCVCVSFVWGPPKDGWLFSWRPFQTNPKTRLTVRLTKPPRAFDPGQRPGAVADPSRRGVGHVVHEDPGLLPALAKQKKHGRRFWWKIDGCPW